MQNKFCTAQNFILYFSVQLDLVFTEEKCGAIAIKMLLFSVQNNY